MTTHELLRCCGESKIAGGMNSSLYFCGVVLTASKAPCLHIATHLHPASTPLYLQCLYICTPATPPAIHTSTLIHLHSCSSPPDLWTSSRPPYLHASTSVGPLQRSRSSYLHVATLTSSLQTSEPPYIYISTSTRMQRTSRSPDLHTPHRYTCRAAQEL